MLNFGRGLAPLRRRDFTLFWAGFAVTRFGRAAEEAGVVWILWTLTESPALLGLLGLVRALPSIALSPIAGAIADRADSRRVLLATQSAGMTASFVLFALVATGQIEAWQVYLQVALQSSIEAFDGGTRLALYPRLVPRSELSEAVTLNSIAGRSAQFVGPAVGGVAIATLGDASPFLLNTVTFVGLIGAVLAMHPVPRLRTDVPAKLRAQVMEGFHFIAASTTMSGLLRLEVVVSVFQVNAVIITIVSQEVLGAGPVELGLLLSAPALGAVLAAVALVAMGHVERQGRLIVFCGLTYAIALAGFGFGGTIPVAFAALAVVGMADAVMTVSRHSIMQLAAPPELRGRVMGTMSMVTRGASPLAEVQSGLLASLFGPAQAVAASAIALAAASVATGWLNRPLWTFRRSVPIED